MRIKQMHKRILGGCLACLLCFTGSIPAFSAETATPANAEASLILVTEIQNEGELLSLPAFTLPLRTTPSDDDLEEIYQMALRYQTVCATVTAGEEIRQNLRYFIGIGWGCGFSGKCRDTAGEAEKAGQTATQNTPVHLLYSHTIPPIPEKTY